MITNVADINKCYFYTLDLFVASHTSSEDSVEQCEVQMPHSFFGTTSLSSLMKQKILFSAYTYSLVCHADEGSI